MLRVLPNWLNSSFRFSSSTSSPKVFYVNIGEFLGFGSKFGFPLFSRLESAHKHFAVIEEHAVHLLDGLVGGLLGLEVDKGITLRAVLITHHFAGQNVPKSRKSIIKCLVIYRFVQVLDKDVSHTRFSQRRIPLRPHDPDRLSLNYIKVHGVQGPLSVSWLLEVDVGITQGAAVTLLRRLVRDDIDEVSLNIDLRGGTMLFRKNFEVQGVTLVEVLGWLGWTSADVLDFMEML